MKKLLALLLAVVMVFSLAACTQTTEPDDTKKNTESTKGNTDETKGDQGDSGELDVSWIIDENPESVSGTVQFWIPFKGSQGMDAMIAEFNEIYPNVEVVLNVYNNNSDGNASVNTSILAGEVDVLASFGLSNTQKRWDAGMFYDLTDLCEEYGIDLVEQWGTDVYRYDDTTYTFPCGGLSYYVSINLDAWEAAGLGELPTEWTWDEFFAAAEKMTEYNDDGSVKVYGGSDYQTQIYWTYCYAQVAGKNPYYNEDGTATVFDSEFYKNALQREYDAEVVNKICYPKSVYRADNLQTQQIFLQDQLANMAIAPNMIRFVVDRENYGTDWRIGFAPWPVEEKGQTNYMSGVAVYSHAGMCIEEGDEDFDACWAWLRWYSTYGVKYLAAAGHQPNWKGTESGSALTLLFGSEEEAAKYIDVDSFKRVVGVSTNPSFVETCTTAYSKINSLLCEYSMYVLNDQMTVEEALNTVAEKANAEIADELNK